jgi:hypothetical protein
MSGPRFQLTAADFSSSIKAFPVRFSTPHRCFFAAARSAQIKTTTYRLERAGDQLRMCEIGAENPTCLYKTEE